jgi:hypothetical protein
MIPPPRRPDRGPRSLALAGALAVIAILALAGRSGIGQRIADRLDTREVPASAFGSQRLRGALTSAGLLHLHPSADGASQAWDGGGSCPDLPIGVDLPAPDELPSSVLPPAGHVRGTVVSLVLDRCRYERLLANPLEHGRDWEEPGWVSVFENGSLRFASAAGVRLHGGSDRPGHRSRRGYRLYFRPIYGAAGLPGEILDAGLDEPVARLVLRYDQTRDHAGRPWSFVQPLAFDLARRMGGVAPHTEPAMLLVNGEAERLVALTEHVGPDFLARRYGHADFDLLHAKGIRPADEQALHDAELGWLDRQPTPLRLEAVAERYAVEELATWMVLNAFCATGDTFQPTLARDRRGAVHGGRWFPIHWDMDVSFLTLRRRGRWTLLQGPLRLALDEQRHPRLLLGRLLHRLLRENPDFRASVSRRLEVALTEEITPEFLTARLAAYQAAADDLGLQERDFFGELREFMARRPQELRDEFQELLGPAPPESS